MVRPVGVAPSRLVCAPARSSHTYVRALFARAIARSPRARECALASSLLGRRPHGHLILSSVGLRPSLRTFFLRSCWTHATRVR
ncbi:hypothetical protein OAO87_02015 [bacterium]|nr:hypothetical protein [bacterium]